MVEVQEDIHVRILDIIFLREVDVHGISGTPSLDSKIVLLEIWMIMNAADTLVLRGLGFKT